MSVHNVIDEINASPDEVANFKTTGIKADVIAESTSAAGVTIDSVLLKDGGVTATGGIKSSSASAGIGYSTGAGGAETQATSKVTAVAVSPATICGAITTAADALGAGAEATFQVSNTLCAATDVVIACIASGPVTDGTYQVTVSAVATNSFKLTLTNLTAGSLSEAIVINWAIIKAVQA